MFAFNKFSKRCCKANLGGRSTPEFCIILVKLPVFFLSNAYYCDRDCICPWVPVVGVCACDNESEMRLDFICGTQTTQTSDGGTKMRTSFITHTRGVPFRINLFHLLGQRPPLTATPLLTEAMTNFSTG